MCENSNTSNRTKDDNLVLIAIGPTNASMSKSCSCLLNATSIWNTVSVTISQENRGRACLENRYDNATLDLTALRGRHLVNFQKANLSDYSDRFLSVSAIRFNITLHSSCASNYTIQLNGSKFSQVLTGSFPGKVIFYYRLHITIVLQSCFILCRTVHLEQNFL